MFKLFIAVVLCLVVAAAIHWSSSGDRQMAAKRVDDQDRILVNLAAMNDPTISEFVNDWRSTFSNPTTEQLSELRVIEQNITNDKKAATKYTLEWHRSNDFICKVSGIGGSHPCEPGL